VIDGSGFSGAGLSDEVGSDGCLLVGVQQSLEDSVHEIKLWVDRLRDGGDPLSFDEALTSIDYAVSVCDGQLSIFESAL